MAVTKAWAAAVAALMIAKAVPKETAAAGGDNTIPHAQDVT